MNRLAVIFLVSATLTSAQDPDPETLRKRTAKVEDQILSEFRSIKDIDSAKAARKGLEAASKEQDEIEQVIAAMTGEARDRVRKQLAADLKPVRASLDKEVARISLIPEAMAVVDNLIVTQVAVARLDELAYQRAANVEKALKAYLLKNDGIPPMALSEVGRYLADKSELKDPWGRDYQLGMGTVGAFTIYSVQTTSPIGGRKIDSRDLKKK